MRITGYVYKFDETFGNYDRKIAKDEIISQECEKSMLVPVPVLSNFMNSLTCPNITDMIGKATLKIDDIGIYTDITVFNHTQEGRIIESLTDEQIKNELNLGLALLGSVDENSEFMNFRKINYIVLGTFVSSHIYKPDHVYR